MPITLSKTDYLVYRECPKNVWFKIHEPDVYFKSELSDFEKAIIETGNEVELVARKLFPDGVLIESRDIDGQQATLDYIAKGQRVIFQAVFSNENFLAALDILEFDPDTNTYSLYEVKATNQIDDKTHYHDLAFQANLLRKAGVEVAKVHIIHLNSEYVRWGELDLANLFKIEDVTAEVNGLCENVLLEMQEAWEYLSKNVEPKGFCCCIYKGRSKHCTTFKRSNPEVPDYSVHDIARIGNSMAKLQELVDQNIFRLEDIPEHIKLSEIQQNQVQAYALGKTTINRETISEELNGLTFPLYFLDYETFPCAIPRFNGFSPYQQVPFQYSLHILHAPGGNLEHKEFLYAESGDPSESFAASLQKEIRTQGSVIVWNKSFESKINQEICKRLDSFQICLDNVNNRMYDLMTIFSKQHYVHKDFFGSASIKYILPTLVPELAYDDLEIREGGTASQTWNKIVTGLVGEE